MYPYSVVLIGTGTGLNDLDLIVSRCAAKLAGRYSDVRAARSARKPGTPAAVFLVQLHDEDDLEQMKFLADAFPGEPIIAMIEGSCDAEGLYKINRAGAAQLVPLPLVPGDLEAALHRVTRQFGRVPPLGKVIAFCGVVGGCGATELVLNFGFESTARWHKVSVLAEPAVPFGRMAVYLDVQHPRPTGDLYGSAPLDLNTIQQALTPVVDGLFLLAAPPPAFPSHPPTSERIEALIDGIRQVADVVIIDLPYSFDETCFRLLARSDEVVLVSDSSVPGLEALRLVRDAVAKRRGAGPIRLAVNRYSLETSPSLERMQSALQAERIWTIAEDPKAFSTAVNQGSPLRTIEPHSPALADIGLLMTEMFGPALVQDSSAVPVRRRMK